MTTGFVQAKPDRGQSFSPTQFDSLSDAELQKLLNDCKVRVSAQQRPQAPKYTDIDGMLKND